MGGNCFYFFKTMELHYPLRVYKQAHLSLRAGEVSRPRGPHFPACQGLACWGYKAQYKHVVC